MTTVASKKELTIPENTEPLVIEMCKLLRFTEITMAQLGEESGVSQSAISSWRYKHRAPSLRNFKAVVNTLGYDVVLVPREKADQYRIR